MSRGRRIYIATLLVLIVTFFYASLSVNGPVLFGPDDLCLFAQDALQAARDSVRESMWSLLATYEDVDELQSPSRYKSINHFGLKFERLQASLEAVMHQVPFTPVVENPSDSINGHLVPYTRQANIDLCTLLAGKRIAMIGGEHIYRLHLLLLRHQEHVEGKPFPCPYHEFCTHHRICLPSEWSRAQLGILPPRYVKPPTTQELVETESATVNYIVSDTLFSAPNESSWEYNLPYLDLLTGIRLRETYWLQAARKAHIVVLGRGPLSAPGETYIGNWSFLHDIPDYVDQSLGAAVIASLHNVHLKGAAYDTYAMPTPTPFAILNAAVHLTVSRFLPDVFQLLQSIRREMRPNKQKRLIWPSSWYRLPDRGSARSAFVGGPHFRLPRRIRDRFQPQSLAEQDGNQEDVLMYLLALVNADNTNTAGIEDMWTLLFNAQVYLQNVVLRELLPRHGIMFLPLDVTPWDKDARDRSGQDMDLERMAAVGDGFLRGLDHVLRFLE